MYKGTQKNSPNFRPGFGWFTCVSAVCITYLSKKTGELVNCFVLDAGTHALRVPSDVIVDVECDDDVKWIIKQSDPHEYPDDTPVEVTVVRPRSLEEEVEQRLLRKISAKLKLDIGQLETMADLDDFHVDDENDAPLSLHQIKTMTPESPDDVKPVKAVIPPPVETKAAAATEESAE